MSDVISDYMILESLIDKETAWLIAWTAGPYTKYEMHRGRYGETLSFSTQDDIRNWAQNMCALKAWKHINPFCLLDFGVCASCDGAFRSVDDYLCSECR